MQDIISLHWMTSTTEFTIVSLSLFLGRVVLGILVIFLVGRRLDFSLNLCTSCEVAPDMFLRCDAAASLLRHRSMHFLRPKFLSCKRRFLRLRLLTPSTIRSLSKLLFKHSQKPHVLANDRRAATYASIGSSDPDREFKGLTKKEQRQTEYYNRNALSEGDVVRIKTFQLGDKVWKKGTVMSRLDERSYMVVSPDGATYRRNRLHLKKTKETPDPPTAADIPFTESSEDKHTQTHTHTGTTRTAKKTTPESAARPQRIRRPPVYLKDYST